MQRRRPAPRSALFDGLTDDQLAELARGRRRRCAFEPGDELFREGEPADFWWVLRRRRDRPASATSAARRPWSARMDAPGRWAGGFRAWDEHGVYLATGRGVERGPRAPGAGRRRCASCADAWFPFGGAPHRGPLPARRARIESTARQRESLVTLGTLAAGLAHEINNPAAAATRAVDALRGRLRRRCCRRCAGSPSGAISAEQFAALDALRRELEPPAGGADPLAVADREDALVGLARPATASSGDWLHRAAARRGRRRRRLVRAGGRPCSTATALEPGLEWVASTLSRRRAARRGQGVDRAASPSWSPR